MNVFKHHIILLELILVCIISLCSVIALASNNKSQETLSGSYSISNNSENENTNLNIPKFFYVCQNFPNPFNAITTINYDLPVKASVQHVIYNIFGKPVRTITNEIQEPDYYSIVWDGFDDNGNKLASGVYLSLLIADDNYSVHKLVLLK